MNDRTLVRGLFLLAISLGFGLGALQYTIGSFERAGPGLFPLMVSGLLLLIAIATIVRSRFVERVPLGFNLKNIALLLLALCSFAVVSKYINMTVGIVVLVFVSSLAATAAYSWKRNLWVSVGLIAVAFCFQKLLGLNLPLY